MKKVCFILFLSFVGLQLSAQQHAEGSLQLHKPDRLDALLVSDSIFRTSEKMDGFRIQLCMESGNDAVRRANEIIAQFEEDFPNIPTYLSFGQPYYRVRVGNFRSRIEAEGQLRFIKNQFNQAFITKDQIELPNLPSFQSDLKNQEDE